MSKTITIRDTKGIKKLNFTFPERKGVYLLVGPNGTGKTTLLICMDRILQDMMNTKMQPFDMMLMMFVFYLEKNNINGHLLRGKETENF